MPLGSARSHSCLRRETESASLPAGSLALRALQSTDVAPARFSAKPAELLGAPPPLARPLGPSTVWRGAGLVGSPRPVDILAGPPINCLAEDGRPAPERAVLRRPAVAPLEEGGRAWVIASARMRLRGRGRLRGSVVNGGTARLEMRGWAALPSTRVRLASHDPAVELSSVPGIRLGRGGAQGMPFWSELRVRAGVSPVKHIADVGVGMRPARVGELGVAPSYTITRDEPTCSTPR